MKYITLDYANEYIGSNFEVMILWNALTDPEKEALIKAGYQVLEKNEWIGLKVLIEQETQFPRDIKSYYDVDEFNELPQEISGMLKQTNTTLPENIKKAQCELIIYYLRQSGNQSLIDLREIGVDSFSIGKINFSFTDEKGKTYPLPPNVWRLAKYWHLYYWQSIVKTLTFVRA